MDSHGVQAQALPNARASRGSSQALPHHSGHGNLPGDGHVAAAGNMRVAR